ncbi:hypothetical protein N7457_001428 [Penicillium paradoxum]|uniref:uncharacterized protein n=1 Tax=Penicillium paradoxum TaxID=176176 RepID=UPI0025485104|nr:uncharacterized protein N7457_001428 [Penicillium paradoxum]KAJ5794829.1 hypothetical protein N7457_001428 [Penicillium paradoxum]
MERLLRSLKFRRSTANSWNVWLPHISPYRTQPLWVPSRLVDNLLPDMSSSWRDWWRGLDTKLDRLVKADDAAITSQLLQQVKASTEGTMSQILDRVAVTDPGFLSLTPATINAVPEIVDLRTWVEADAVYRANGYRLYINNLDNFQCIDEIADAPAPPILFVSLSNDMLYTSIIHSVPGVAA